MKEIVVMSGKGGTGKTSISAALAQLVPQKILADCDVDAANLHLVTGCHIQEKHDFLAGFEPQINRELCIKCGKCTEACRFDAIFDGAVSPLACEGCGVCAQVCPEKAIVMNNKSAGQWFVSYTRFGPLVHAELGLAVENSGKLVSQVRQQAKRLAERNGFGLVITDGPPGIGCPAIAALSGASIVVGVVEPSISGIHDALRLYRLVQHFGMPFTVCINKATLNSDNTAALRQWCAENHVAVAGEIPYSPVFRQAVQAGKTVMEMEDRQVKDRILGMWEKIYGMLDVS